MDIAQSVLAKVADGRLPLPESVPGKVWGGHGTARVCDGCDTTITAAEIEYEVDLVDRVIRFHSTCLFAWQGTAPPASRADS